MERGLDSHGIGRLDDWQRLYFGADATSWPQPSVDSDGDGVDNRNEFLAGTSPTNGSSVLRVAMIPSQQGVLLQWNSIPGAMYQPQWSSNLKEWTDLGAPRLSAGTVDSVDGGEAPGGAYFRVNFLR